MSNRNGQSLLMSYMIVLILSVFGGTFLTHGITASKHTQIRRHNAEAFYLAQGGLEDATRQFLDAIANFDIDADVERYPENGTLDISYDVAASFPEGATVTAFVTEAEADNRVVNDPDGLAVIVKNYQVTATATHPANPGVAVTLHQMITRRLIYTFQHAVFYDQDLEMLPGPNMTLSGRIHSNSDIYLDTHNTFTIEGDHMRSAGNMYNERKDDGSTLSGDVVIEVAGSPGTYVGMNNFDSDSANWVNESQTRWGGSVKTADHGVSQLSVPQVGSIQNGGFYDTKAGLKVINGQLVTPEGTPLVEGVDIPEGTVTTSNSFYNNREGKWVTMTDIDMRKLAGYEDDDPDGSPSFSNRMPGNGLIYATRNDAGAGQPGIRLKNGQKIERNGGLTVVSDAPVYIEGDFNTVDKQPSAVICDAVNILSNDWDDSNSFSGLSSRVADETTVNLAFISGIDDTTTGNYNGGLENYPRLHESWSGRELEIRGSFVALWNSVMATGAWQYGGSQYKAPIRNWNYDQDFLNGDMPPFTPWAVEADKGAWWKE